MFSYRASVGAMLCILCCTGFSYAQQTRPVTAPGVITGSITAEATSKPLGGAAVTVRNARDSALVTGVLANAQGKFRIDNLAPGTYTLGVSFLGYKARVSNVSITAAQPSAEVGVIALRTDVIAVQGVTAETQRSAVTLAADRSIYTTKGMVVAAGGNATDVLRNIPELQVDVDGSVRMNGSQSVVIHLNGRPAPMRGDALRSFLQNMPGNRIDRVEVVPNPSAKYDPEGISGIVNIVLKESVDLGFSGSANVGTDTRGRHGGNLNMAYQRGRLTTFGNTALFRNRLDNNSYELRKNLLAAPTTFFESDAANKMSGRGIWFDGSAEYKAGKLETVYATQRMNDGENGQDGLTAYSVLDATRAPTEQFDYLFDNEFEFKFLESILGFRRIVKPQQHELTIEARRTQNDQLAGLNATRTVVPAEFSITENQTVVTDYILQLDYVRTTKTGLKLETGYKGVARGTDYENRLGKYRGTTSSAPSSVQSSVFDYGEDYHQAYALFGRQFAKGKYSAQLGARAEIAQTDFTLPTQKYHRDYNSVYPSVNFAWAPSPKLQARVAYSKRIERPWPGMLNPGVPVTDSLNRFVGNPELKPKYTHSYTADFTHPMKLGSIRFSPYYRHTINNWEFLRHVDANGVATVTWVNTSSVDALGATTTLNLRSGEKWNGFLNLNLFHYERDATNLASTYSADGFQWEVSMNGNAKLGQGTYFQTFFRYVAPLYFPQGKQTSQIFNNFGFRQELMNRKANLTLMYFDPLHLWRRETRSYDVTHEQYTKIKFGQSAVRLTFGYTFGKTPQSVRRREDQPEQQEAAPPIR
jgi:ferric enterobactin receptor